MVPWNCDICGGLGYIQKGEGETDQCLCLYLRKLKQHLNKSPDILAARTIKESPLYVPAPLGEEAVADFTTKNVFLKGYWDDILSHLKWVFYNKGLRFRWRVTTDDEIKGISFGEKSYTKVSKKNRDVVPTFNTLEDFVGGDIDLVVLRLGVVYKNVALPSIIRAALLIRASAAKPTWLIDPTDSEFHFAFGHPSYSPELATYIDRCFEVIEIPPIGTPMPPIQPPQRNEDGSVDLSLGADPSEERPLMTRARFEPSAPPRQEKPSTDVFELLDDPVLGGGSKHNFKNKKKGGGGPVGGIL